MQILAVITYVLFLVYVANVLMLSVVAAKLASRPVWLLDGGGPLKCLAGWAFCLAFAGAILWPPFRFWSGGLEGDPVAAALHGLTASLSGHLLVALGAAIALDLAIPDGRRMAHRRARRSARRACADRTLCDLA